MIQQLQTHTRILKSLSIALAVLFLILLPLFGCNSDGDHPNPSPTLAPSQTPVQTSTSSSTPVPFSSPTPSLKGTLQVHFIDVGQGDSILIVSPGGKTMLIDGGEPNSGALQYLQSKGVKHLDVMVATHPHSDHIGGLPQILKAIPVDEVVTNGQPTTTATYEHFLDAISDAKAQYVEVNRGDTLPLGELSFAVLNPGETLGDDLNHNSIVLRLVYGEISFLFMGDADAAAEADIMASGVPIQADILKVGHHGSRYSSSPPFLLKVQPKVAIYSAGTGNPYGHPHQETLDALNLVGAHIYGTDINGTVVVTSDGATYQVTPTK